VLNGALSLLRGREVRPERTHPLLTTDIRRLITTLSGALLGVRDAVVLLIGFAGGFRRHLQGAVTASSASTSVSIGRRSGGRDHQPFECLPKRYRHPGLSADIRFRRLFRPLGLRRVLGIVGAAEPFAKSMASLGLGTTVPSPLVSAFTGPCDTSCNYKRASPPEVGVMIMLRTEST
jgi:hypothetical protein